MYIVRGALGCRMAIQKRLGGPRSSSAQREREAFKVQSSADELDEYIISQAI